MSILLLVSLILLFCCFSSKIMYKVGVPTLLLFLILGMSLGSDGFGIEFDNAKIAEEICTVALIFIMFYGGFGLNWKRGKSSALAAGLLATVGTVITAVVVGFGVHFIFKVDIIVGMLLGSVIASTDAASVFSILNSHNVSLKKNMNYLLEIESGSNDPLAYMMTMIFISIATNQEINILATLLLQLSIGVIIGLIVGRAGVIIINKINLEIDGLYSILVIGLALLAYALATQLNGNGFLSVYLAGIIIGNSKIVHRYSMIKYFDGLTWLMQIILFITLGLLSFPSQMASEFKDGVIIALFVFFIARPIAVGCVLIFFKKYNFKDFILVSWAGFRGAASIVFATMVLSNGVDNASWYFNVVFITAMLSVLFQGTLFIPLAKKLKLVESDTDTLTSFYSDSGNVSTQILEVDVTTTSPALNKRIVELDIPDSILIVMIQRDGKVMTPKGNTKLKYGDRIMLSGPRKQLVTLSKQIENRKKQEDYNEDLENAPI